jgi:Xaa-Pro aminopeptidase
MGVRIEDLVTIDASKGHLETLTRFPREVLVVGA